MLAGAGACVVTCRRTQEDGTEYVEPSMVVTVDRGDTGVATSVLRGSNGSRGDVVSWCRLPPAGFDVVAEAAVDGVASDLAGPRGPAAWMDEAEDGVTHGCDLVPS